MYQGFSNRETWAVCLWCMNDIEIYKLVNDLETWQGINRAVNNYCSDNADVGLIQDLVRLSLDRVKWEEVLNHIKSA